MRHVSVWRIEKALHGLAALAVAVSMGFAADYGMGSAHAATLMAPSASVQAPAAPLAVSPSAAPAPRDAAAMGSDPGTGKVRLPGHVLSALSAAVAVGESEWDSRPLTLTLTLKRDDPAGFARYLKQVYDPSSPNFRHFLNQRQLTHQFGPSLQAYDELLRYVRKQGFRLVAGSTNRQTLTVRGSRAAAAHTFALSIRNYRLGTSAFFANDVDPALPSPLAAHVENVAGLSNLGLPHAAKEKYPATWGALCGGGPGISSDFVDAGAAAGAGTYSYLVGQFGAALPAVAGKLGLIGFGFIGFLAAFEWQVLCQLDGMGYFDGPFNPVAKQYNAFMLRAGAGTTRQTADLAAVNGTDAADGNGQTVGLLEFDTYQPSDVVDYLNLTEGTSVNSANLSNVHVAGGATAGANQDEVLLDVDTVMSLAPGAKVVVYDAPFTGQATAYTALFNAMINGGVTVISNSWASCEDQVSLADAQAIDSVLQTAAASGITVLNGSGDQGSTCLDGAVNTIAVPADSPNATAVGGTTLNLGAAFTYLSETWWDGSNSVPQSGQGGFGTSRYFNRPTYQSGVTTAAARSVPDVAIDADPATGMIICQASAGGCPVAASYGGTSMAAPEMAAYVALLNEALGHNLGALNPQIYPLAASTAFHTPASMGSDFAHVGLGSPNVDLLSLSLKGQSAGAPSTTASIVLPLEPYAALQPAGASAQVAMVAADGSTPGGVLVQLFDAQGNTVSGKTIQLNASGSATVTAQNAVTTVNNGTALFTVTDPNTETVTYTATDVTDGVTLAQSAAITFVVPPAVSAGISGNPASLPADGQSAATITVTLKDALNRPTPGKTIAVADAGAHAVITGPASGVTDANGQIQLSVTDQVNETVTFTAVDVTDSNLPIPGSATVTYSGSASTACGVGVVPTAGAGYTIAPYITGLTAAPTIFYNNVNIGCPGADNPAFLSSGAVLAADFLTGGLYQTGLTGGAVSSANLLGNLGPTLTNLTFGIDGSLYATEGSTGAQIVQLDPTTGTVLRTVASGLTCPTGLAVDPLSGDLFFDDDCTGAGLDSASIYRVIDPANSNAGVPTSVVVYATLPSTPNGGMAFAPNGTLYAVSGYYGNINAPVEQISPTSAASVTVTPVTGISSDFAVAIGAANTDGSAASLIVEPAGTLSEVPISNPGSATVLATGSPGVGVTGPDGCLYSAHYDTIYRLASSSGTCQFAPTSPAPSLLLTPTTVSPNPTQGAALTFTATLRNVSPLAGVPVFFLVHGANTQTALVDSDTTGHATYTYTAAHAGSDSVTVATTANQTALSSNSVHVTWAAGQHVTFLALNASPQSGIANQSVNVVAALADTSTSPAASIVGQTIHFSVQGSTCTAVTASNGSATCALTPTQVGTSTLSATFAGNSQYVAATASVAFHVTAAVVTVPAPTVTITVAPTTVTTGTPAQLNWSSANATACTASGAWSGTQLTAGTLSVNPASPGTYTYTLSCSGASGATTAQAVLTVKPAVTTSTVITWPTPAPIAYGTALGASQLDATANVAGTFTYSPAAGTVLAAGVHTLTVRFTPSNSAYSSVTASVELTVQQATPIILWLPIPLFQGTALGLLQLDAIAFEPGRFCRFLPGKFVYTPPAGTVLSEGVHVLAATFTPDDTDFKSITVHATLDVRPKPRGWPW